MWPKVYQNGEVNLVDELTQIQGQIVISVSIGAEYVNHELPYKDYATGKTKNLRIGNFL